MTQAAAPTSLAGRLEAVHERITLAATRSGRNDTDVRLIAVTKTHSAEAALEALRSGVPDLGENRVQEGAAKAAQLSETLGPSENTPRWHLIGHLQTNKVRAALGTFAILHSVDSERLLQAINSNANGPVTVMVEVNVSGEATKFGVQPVELPRLLEVASTLPHVTITGLMTVAPLDPDPESARPIFRELRHLADNHHLPHLSMGMTNDFEVAIEEGATFVRVGRALFGDRA